MRHMPRVAVLLLGRANLRKWRKKRLLGAFAHQRDRTLMAADLES